MRKFYCKDLDEDIEYSRCCNCKGYNDCPIRDIEGTQRMVGVVIIIVCLIILLIIGISYLRELL